MSATEGRRRVPILDPERERRATKPGDVVTYTLTPEEIEARYGKKTQAEKPLEKQPILTISQQVEQKKNREQTLKEESEVPRELPISKERYLEMRLEGLSRADIAREIGLKYASDIYPMLGRIGLRDTVVEAQEMEKLAQQKAAIRKVVDNAVADAKKALDELPQASDVSHGVGDQKSAPALTDVMSTPARGEVDEQSDALDLASFNWISPQFNRGREGVYLTKHDLRISGATAKPFESARFAQIGVKPGVVVVRVATVGWKVRRNNKASGVYIGGALLQKALLSAGFSTKTTIEATWDSYNGVLVCRVTGDAKN